MKRYLEKVLFRTSGENNENVLVKICKGTVSWKKSVRVYFSFYFKGPFSRFRIWAAHPCQYQIKCPPPTGNCIINCIILRFIINKVMVQATLMTIPTTIR